MLNDLLKSISSKDYVSAKEIVESLINEKIAAQIDLRKVEIADEMFNESAYEPGERLADLTKIKTKTLQQIHALHRHYGQTDPRTKESANRAAAELKKRGIIVPVDEAWRHDDVDGKRAHGEFQEKDVGKWFTYRKTNDPWAAKHGLTHKIDVADGHRFGKVLGTRVHIATDENDDGTPKMETWHLKKHHKWTQNESVEIEEGYYASGTVGKEKFHVKYPDFPGKSSIKSQNPHLSSAHVDSLHDHMMKFGDDDMTDTSSKQGVHRVMVTDNGGHMGESVEISEAKIDHKTALDILNQAGGSTSDFHELGSNEVDTLLKHAKIHKYRKSPSAPGSTARMFHQHLTKIVRANEKSGPSWK